MEGTGTTVEGSCAVPSTLLCGGAFFSWLRTIILRLLPDGSCDTKTDAPAHHYYLDQHVVDR